MRTRERTSETDGVRRRRFPGDLEVSALKRVCSRSALDSFEAIERGDATNLSRSSSRYREGRVETMVEIVETRRSVPIPVRYLHDLRDSSSIGSVDAVLKKSDELDSAAKGKTGEGVAGGGEEEENEEGK